MSTGRITRSVRAAQKAKQKAKKSTSASAPASAPVAVAVAAPVPVTVARVRANQITVRERNPNTGVEEVNIKVIKHARGTYAGPNPLVPLVAAGKLAFDTAQTEYHWDKALNCAHSRLWNKYGGVKNKVKTEQRIKGAKAKGVLRANAIKGMTVGSEVGSEDTEFVQFKFLPARYVDADHDQKKWL